MSNLTPRQERFCQRFVYCLNAAKAARDAGYAPGTANQQGYRLLQDPRVARRIQDIQWTLAEQHGRDTDTLVGKLEMVYRRAMEDGRYHAAVRAVALQSELTTGGSMPHRLWRDLAEAAAKTLKAAERNQAEAPSPPGDTRYATSPPGDTRYATSPPGDIDILNEPAPPGDTRDEPASPLAGEARLKAVGA